MLVASAAAIPWLVSRGVLGLFDTSGLGEYLEHVFVAPFILRRWHPPQWYDMLLWLSLAATVGAFWWHLTIPPAARLASRIAKWVDRG